VSETRRTVTAEGAPAPIGPYCHAVAAGNLLFCSGQIGLDPESSELVDGSAGDEAGQALRNLAAVCAGAGTSLEHAVRLTLYTTVPERFDEINAAYAAHFPDDPPARAVIGVAELPMGALVEIEAVVALGT
jgi:2-iminobutanoate/2-iminopropanoate deaminase